MNNSVGKALTVIVILLLSLSTSYIGVSFSREYQFRKEYEKWIEKELAALEKARGELDRTSLNPGSIDEIMHYLDGKPGMDAATYAVLGTEYLIGNPTHSYVYKLPEIYGKINAIQLHLHVMATSYAHTSDCILGAGKLLSKKMPSRENADKYWWHSFEISPEFQSYLFSCPIYGETYTEDEMNRIYEEIQDIEIPEKLSLMRSFLQYWPLKTEKMIAEEAFWNYKKHLYEKDYISAMVDKNVFIHAWFDINIIEHLTTLHDYFYTLKNYALYLGIQKYFFYDLAYLLFLTITIFILLYLIFIRFIIGHLL